MKERLRVLIVTMIVLSVCNKCIAQTHMRIHHNDGGHSDVPIEQIDSITFVNDDEAATEEAELVGSWLWGDVEAGYYEMLTFNSDRTYTGYDKYLTYGFDTMTYGWYIRYGSLLTLQSNGFGYNRRYTWFLTGLTENALEVVTKMGSYTYYRLQPETITLKIGESKECGDGDSFVFADGVVVGIDDKRLVGMAVGVTYVLKHNVNGNNIVAYKVIVE